MGSLGTVDLLVLTSLILLTFTFYKKVTLMRRSIVQSLPLQFVIHGKTNVKKM